MDEVHRLADKLNDETSILDQMVFGEDAGPEHMDILVQQGKRVRRLSNLLVQALASERDHYLQRLGAQGDQ